MANVSQEMKSKMSAMSRRIRQLEDALRQLESSVPSKQESIIPAKLLATESRNEELEGQFPVEVKKEETDSITKLTDDFASVGLSDVEEARFIGLQSVEVCNSVSFLFSCLTARYIGL